MGDQSYTHGSGITLEDHVEDAINRIAPGYMDWKDIPVLFERPELLEEYSDALYQRLSFELGEAFERRVNPEDLVSYFMTLVMIRVHYVNDDMAKSRMYDRFLVIPAFMSQYLRQIGYAISDGLGVRLFPTLGSVTVLDPDKAREVSNALRQLKSVGLEFTDVMPRDKRGSWDFMSLQHVDNQIVSHSDEVHPSIALAGAFVSMKQVQEVFNPLVSYGSPSSYSRVVNGLVESRRI